MNDDFEFIDDLKDHIEGLDLKPQLVYEWIKKMSRYSTNPELDTWIAFNYGLKVPYTACICNHYIERNFALVNTTTKKAIILGSECIKKFKKYTNVKITSKPCIYCSLKVEKKNEVRCNRCIIGSKKINFGKHKGNTFDYIRKNDKSYCEWLLKKETMSEYDIVVWLKTFKEYSTYDDV